MSGRSKPVQTGHGRGAPRFDPSEEKRARGVIRVKEVQR
jgi:hypothetical protein